MTFTVSIDCETHLIQPGLLAPKLVCVSYCHRDDDGQLQNGLLNFEDGIAFVRSCLEAAVRGEGLLVLQNGVFDFAVFCAADPSLLDLVFEAYDKSVIRDTKERQKLIDLADGNMKFLREPETGEFKKASYSLEALTKRHLGWQLDKSEDSWRLRYAELDGVPVADYPEAAARYAIQDAISTLLVYEKQNETLSPVVVNGVVTNESDQLRAHWALHLQSVYGIKTDPKAVAELRVRVTQELTECERKIKELEDRDNVPEEWRCYKSHTFQRGSKAGQTLVSRNMRAIQKRVAEGFRKQGLEPPLTDGGLTQVAKQKREATGELELAHVQTSEEAMLDSGDEVLAVMASGMFANRVLTSYVPLLETGATVPMNVNYNLIVETGRTSCPKPSKNSKSFNPQVLPKKPGVRECIVPRPGFLLCSVDYDQLELCTLAQVLYDLFESSSLGELINAGKDLHVAFAATYLNIPYDVASARYKQAKKDKTDQEILDARQLAKAPNFGIPGGMGATKFVDYCKNTWGVKVTLEESKRLKKLYLETFPDMNRYFEYIATLLGPTSEGMIVQPRSGRVRGGVIFTEACNTNFQGLAADGAKLALWRVARECYQDFSSPLYGSRPIAFIHDEILAEVPEHSAHEASTRLAAVMIEAMQHYTPNVKISASPALMRRWYKGADAVYDANGRLIPWEPKKKEVHA